MASPARANEPGTASSRFRRELVEERPVGRDFVPQRVLRECLQHLVEQLACGIFLAHAFGQQLRGEQAVLRHVGMLGITLVRGGHQLQCELGRADVDRLARNARDFVRPGKFERRIEFQALARDRRKALDDEFTALSAEVTRIISTTTYEGGAIFGAAAQTYQVSASDAAADNLSFTIDLAGASIATTLFADVTADAGPAVDFAEVDAILEPLERSESVVVAHPSHRHPDC